MRGGRNISDAAAAIEYLPMTFAEPINLDALFPNGGAPLEVDLGCGDGTFLAARAQQHTDRNFLGLEKLHGRVGASCRRIDRLELTNARIIRCEIGAAVRALFPHHSVDVFHLMFPDPWPKRRHQSRRVFTPELLHSLDLALKISGLLHLATDQREYFAEMLETVSAEKGFCVIDKNAFEDSARSTFEERFIEAGEPVHRLVLRKISG